MTDMTFAPMMVNAFLIIMISVDLIAGTWSIFTSIELGALIAWNSLLLWLTYGPQPPELTPSEWVNKNPEFWSLYFATPWNDFWELNDGRVSTIKETPK